MMNYTNRKNKTVAIMSRVSSDEQALGYSLGVQEESLRKHAARNEYEILHVIVEDHSAKNFERPEFQKFLCLVKSKKLKVDALMFTSWDRYSRNITDALVMRRLLESFGVALLSVEQPLDMSVPENLTVLGIYLTLPEVDNKRRSMKIRGGVRAALKSGRYPRLAPFGYKNARDENNKPILVLSKDADNIRYLFKQISRGVSQIDIRKELKIRGLNLDKSVVSRLLRNPMYLGKIEVPEEGDEPYMLVDGLHEALIDTKTFFKVQEELNGRNKIRARPNSNMRREELPLRGILHCSFCESRMTGSPSRGKTGKRYFYYHCNECGKGRVRSDDVNDAIIEILGAIQFKKSVDERYEGIFKQELKHKFGAKVSSLAAIEEKLDAIKKKLNNIQDLLAAGDIKSEDYREMKSRFEIEKLDLEKKLTPVKEENADERTRVREALSKIVNLQKIYLEGDIPKKHIVWSSTFPEKLFFLDGKCRTLRLSETVRRALNADKGFRGNEKRQIHSKLDLSLWVDPQRIELWSKQALNMLSTCVADY
ncbi:recombinase family protein [soil metagenome]